MTVELDEVVALVLVDECTTARIIASRSSSDISPTRWDEVVVVGLADVAGITGGGPPPERVP